jgi:hypothetical protein
MDVNSTDDYCFWKWNVELWYEKYRTRSKMRQLCLEVRLCEIHNIIKSLPPQQPQQGDWPDDGGSTHLWNVVLLRDYTAQYSRGLSFSKIFLVIIIIIIIIIIVIITQMFCYWLYLNISYNIPQLQWSGSALLARPKDKRALPGNLLTRCSSPPRNKACHLS